MTPEKQAITDRAGAILITALRRCVQDVPTEERLFNAAFAVELWGVNRYILRLPDNHQAVKWAVDDAAYWVLRQVEKAGNEIKDD